MTRYFFIGYDDGVLMVKDDRKKKKEMARFTKEKITTEATFNNT